VPESASWHNHCSDSAARERQLRHAVFELARAFAQAYLHFLDHIRGKRLRSAWVGAVPAILVRLFYHRQVELLLHLLRYEAWPRGRWREVHDAYRFGQEVLAQLTSADEKGVAKSAIACEDMYVRLLLTQLLDTGQFPTPELAIARKWIARWSHLVPLRAMDAGAAASAHGFIVDTAGATGLRRPSARSHGKCAWLDTTPIAAAIDSEIDAMRDDASVSRARRLALLARMRTVFAPVPMRVERRGERSVVALMSVQTSIGGLASTFSMLREEWRRRADTASPSAASSGDDISIMGRPPSPGRALAAVIDDGSAAFPATASFGVPQPSWQVCDRSVSGSRLRGRVSNPRRVVPGSLIAFRHDARAPWTLAIVRRLRRLPGSNVEVGVEHLGCNPQPIVLTLEQPGASGARCFPALYLRESAMEVNSRVRSLVLPASQFAPGRIFAMSSAKVEATIRLKGPLEYQSDFVWTAFEVLGSTPPRTSSVPDASKAPPVREEPE
jgi:hypothetical protein